MADEAREYIRAAQAAEIKGDKTSAVELLRKAAVVYRNEGNPQRALQMLRHARRLDGASVELAEEVSRMEWIPDRPLERAGADDEPDRALAVLDELAAPPQHLVERGPTRADPSLDAWCSFCCKPKKEVGALVAGPAGAFICSSCVLESGRLLDAAPAVTKAPTVAPADQAQAREALEAALKAAAPEILKALVDRIPAGSGEVKPEKGPGKRRKKKA